MVPAPKWVQRGLLVLSLFLAISLFGFTARAQDSSAAPPRADSRTANNADFLAAADEVLQQMSEITGLKLLTPLKKSLRSDRKSTRLNSSHVEISYAVFCLKKKTKKINN